MRITPRRRRRDEVPLAEADDLVAELASAYWTAYRERMASIGFVAMARQFPALIGHAVRLGSQASRRDTIAPSLPCSPPSASTCKAALC